MSVDTLDPPLEIVPRWQGLAILGGLFVLTYPSTSGMLMAAGVYLLAVGRVGWAGLRRG